MVTGSERRGLSRRALLVGGGAGLGLLLAWNVWPRHYAPNLRADENESVFGAFLKIGSDGRVTVAVPQAELGQGVYTSLPQILADELGADWRTIAVEPASVGPLYANPLLAGDAGLLERARRWAEGTSGGALAMATGGSTSIRAFEAPLREAGAGARALLMKAAAARWNVPWERLDTAQGFVTDGPRKLSFAELAEAAAGEEMPEMLPYRSGPLNRLSGQSLPRLDLPSKVDGTARFAADVRLPGMLYASVRSAPPGGTVARADKRAALAIGGVVGAYRAESWVGAIGTSWWAANRGLEAMKPVFGVQGGWPTSASIDGALAEGVAGGEASRVAEWGDAEAALQGAEIVRARYRAAPAPSAALETLTATARLEGGRLEIWAPAQAPGLARAAAARAAGLPEASVTLYPMLIGGGYGRKLEVRAIEQAVALAREAKRPVQLVYSRAEEATQDSFRAPAAAELSASLGPGGVVLGWQARIAAPDGAGALAERLGGHRGAFPNEEPAAGAVPPYAIPSVAVDHLPVELGIATGAWRSGAHGYTAFFTESFVDELARKAGLDPFSFRMQMLGRNPRLARVLSTAAALGGWDGGMPGSRMGIACHSAFGSFAATLVEVEVGADQRVRVLRAAAAVDCGRVVNPDIVKQQIEGGILFAVGAATGSPVHFADGRPDKVSLRSLGLPTLVNSPEVTVEVMPSEEPPGGVTELGVPSVAPAIANALFAATGQRLRSLPLVVGGA
jgi:isoquinoline 1-oxidoreductase beta subunit